MTPPPPPHQQQPKSAGQILLIEYTKWLDAKYPDAKDSVLHYVTDDLREYRLEEAIKKLTEHRFDLACVFLDNRKAEEDRRKVERKADIVKRFIPGNSHADIDNIARYCLEDATLLRKDLKRIGSELAPDTFKYLCMELEIAPDTHDASAETTATMLTWLRDFPSHPAENQLIQHARDLEVEHFPPLKDLFVRESYLELLKLILDLGPKRTIAITGDPGVGKSSFSLFVLLSLAKQDQSVVHVSQGGMAFVYRKGSNMFEHRPADEVLEWKQNDCWLLLDGRAMDIPYLQKKSRGVVFASPQKSNYHEFVKASGLMMYMPPWSSEEVKSFVNNVKEEDREKWRFFRPDLHLPPDPEETSKNGADLDPEDEIVNGLNSREMLELDTTGAILDIVQLRFAIVGGRIRLLLSDRYLLTQLRDKVKRSVSHLTPKELSDIESVDIGGLTPSLGYSIHLPPLKTSAKYLDYQLDFCSEVALKSAHRALLRHYQSSQHALFMQTLGNSSAAAMSGHLFEFMCHDLVQRIFTISERRAKKADAFSPYTLKDIRVKIFNLKDADADVVKTINVEFYPYSPDFPEKLYTEVQSAQQGTLTAAEQTGTYKFHLQKPESFSKDGWKKVVTKPYGTYFQPTERNFPDVDALFHNILLQMTVSLKHPFQMNRVRKLMDVSYTALKTCEDPENPSFDFVYVVPDEILDKFPYQQPLTTGDTPLVNTPKDDMQMVAIGIPSKAFSDIWNAS